MLRSLFVTLLLAPALGSLAVGQTIDWEVHVLDQAGSCTALAINNDSVWVGTTEGLYRYDGSAWTRFSVADGLPDNHIKALSIGADGAVWIGTASGIAHYTVENGLGERFTSTLGGSDVTALHTLADHAGTILIGTADGRVFSYLPGGFNPSPIELEITAAQLGLVTSIGALFAPQFNSTLHVFRSTQGIVLTTPDYEMQVPVNTTSSNILPSNNILCGVESAEGVAYDGTDKGLYIAGFDGSGFRVENEGLPDLRVQALALAGDVLWIGTPQGLARKVGSQVTDVYTAENSSLPGNDVRAVAVVESTGTVWVGTADGHVSSSRAMSNAPDRTAGPSIAWSVVPTVIRDRARLTVHASTPEQVSVAIVDINGKIVRSDNFLVAGDRTITLDVEGLRTGYYVCRLCYDGRTESTSVRIVR